LKAQNKKQEIINKFWGSALDATIDAVSLIGREGKMIEFPWPVADIILQHHERMDGSGYPKGLKGKDICIGARILAAPDVIEAMSSYRPYRPALGIDKAVMEIKKGKGKLYDPRVVDACVKLITKKKLKF